jgi:hypothetical protein
MRFRSKTQQEIMARLSQLGLSSCSVCQTGALFVSPYPVLVNFGGFPVDPSDPRHDPDANVWFALKVECDVCGHMMLFNSERYHGPDEKVLYRGPVEPQSDDG